MGKTTLVLASMTLAVLLACMAAVLAAVPGFAQSATVTLVGAGDIARCDARGDEHTAKLINNVLRNLTPDGTLPALNRARVITLGDNAYTNGSRLQFAYSSPTATTIIVSPSVPASIPPARPGGVNSRDELCLLLATTNTSTRRTPL
jgi:hypothetical protein